MARKQLNISANRFFPYFRPPSTLDISFFLPGTKQRPWHSHRLPQRSKSLSSPWGALDQRISYHSVKYLMMLMMTTIVIKLNPWRDVRQPSSIWGFLWICVGYLRDICGILWTWQTTAWLSSPWRRRGIGRRSQCCHCCRGNLPWVTCPLILWHTLSYLLEANVKLNDPVYFFVWKYYDLCKSDNL